MQLTDRAQDLLAIAEDDSEFPEVLVVQISQNGDIDPIFEKPLGIGRHAQRLEPLFDLLHSILDPGAIWRGVVAGSSGNNEAGHPS